METTRAAIVAKASVRRLTSDPQGVRAKPWREGADGLGDWDEEFGNRGVIGTRERSGE